MAHPKYQEIADRLRAQINSGALAPGQRLPSEPDLAAEYDASRNTVRLAIALLINQGLVVSRQGLGTFVLEPTKPFTALLSRIHQQPDEHHASRSLPVVSPAADESEMVRLIVETAFASPSVAEKLDVVPGDAVVVRRSQYFIGDVPWQLINSYYPSDLAKGTALEQASEIEAGSIGLLSEMGYPQRGFVDEIGARMPNAREFDFFKLASGTPVLVVTRTSYSADRPIRLTRYIYSADRVRLLHVEGTIPDSFRHS
ncbi:MAG TPA: GntR family transcriptional regulator [Streptosporangiaceae bacterium]|nr:GntR family transcriptional regulator [Streptosporangiaceae bacterium]